MNQQQAQVPIGGKVQSALERQRDDQRIRAAILSQPFKTVITAGDEAANVRRVTIECTDRHGYKRPARYLVRVWISATSLGVPGGSQTISLVTGTLIQTVSANVALVIASDANGAIVFDLDAGAGAQTRYVSATIIGEAAESAALTYA